MKVLQRRPEVLNKVLLLPVEEILPSPHQPRRIFEEKELDILAKSISQNGLLVPVSVRKIVGGYVLIAGERRLLACRRLGMRFIPAIVEDRDELSSAVLTLIENIHREDLNCFEEAEGIRRLMEQEGLSQSRVCNLISMAQPTVANKLRLLRLPLPVRELLLSYGLGERVGRALLTLEREEDQLKACRHIGENALTAAQAEDYINALLQKRKPAPRRGVGHLRDYRILFSAVDKAVAEIKKTGVSVQTQKSEEEELICYTIRIPKAKPAPRPEQAEPAKIYSLRTG